MHLAKNSLLTLFKFFISQKVSPFERLNKINIISIKELEFLYLVEINQVVKLGYKELGYNEHPGITNK